MKSSVLIAAIAAATAAFAVSGSALADAQAQASALLSPTNTSAGFQTQQGASSQSVVLDAQAHAAAVLSGVRPDRVAESSAQVAGSPASRESGDAQAQAAALLSGSRSTSVDVARTTATREKLGAHPAVIVAQTWNSRGIDPNSFIVAHPARLQLISVSPGESETQLAQAKEAAAATVSGGRSGLNN